MLHQDEGSSPPLLGEHPSQGGTLVAPREADDRSGHLHRLLIGMLGFFLPAGLWAMSVIRPLPGLSPWRPLDSISAYYYTGAVAVFVGTLAALAVFFFTYRGYRNAFGRRDRIAATVAGAAAVMVILVPTGAPEPLLSPPWWSERSGAIHYASAVVLFGSFVYFAIFQFPITKLEDEEPVSQGKKVRNRIYRICGGTMLAGMAWAAVAGWRDASIFWGETLALEAFAVSWLVKGRADVAVSRTLARVRRS